MREIKFRAWHITDKKMLSHSDLVDMNICADTYLFSYEIFIPLQFTDLHDKNGKEIYEGDVLKIVKENDSDHGFHFPLNSLKVVEWVDDMFCLLAPSYIAERERIESKNPNGSICEKCSGWKGLYSENHEIDIGFFSEIVGNIHENPELLKNSD